MHMDGVPSFLKKHGARENTLYSWQNTRLLRCDGKLAGGLISYDGATHEERRRNTWVLPDGRQFNSGDVPETVAGEYYLDSLAIIPEFRGPGLWKMLFDDAIETAKEKGFHRVTLICEESYPKLATFILPMALCQKIQLCFSTRFAARCLSQYKKHNKSSEFHSVLILDIGVLNLVCQLLTESLLCIVFGHFY